jgi:hypothetical protein
LKGPFTEGNSESFRPHGGQAEQAKERKARIGWKTMDSAFGIEKEWF